LLRTSRRKNEKSSGQYKSNSGEQAPRPRPEPRANTRIPLLPHATDRNAKRLRSADPKQSRKNTKPNRLEWHVGKRSATPPKPPHSRRFQKERRAAVNAIPHTQKRPSANKDTETVSHVANSASPQAAQGKQPQPQHKQAARRGQSTGAPAARQGALLRMHIPRDPRTKSTHKDTLRPRPKPKGSREQAKPGNRSVNEQLVSAQIPTEGRKPALLQNATTW
jgi:hypothetical protein